MRSIYSEEGMEAEPLFTSLKILWEPGGNSLPVCHCPLPLEFPTGVSLLRSEQNHSGDSGGGKVFGSKLLAGGRLLRVHFEGLAASSLVTSHHMVAILGEFGKY